MISNNKKIALGILLVLVGLLWFSDSFELNWGSEAKATHPAKDTLDPAASESAQPIAPRLIGGSPNSVSGTGTLAEAATDLEKQMNFKQFLGQVSSCLKVSITTPTELNSSYSVLMSAVKFDLGDPLMRSEDWSNTTLKSPNGEVKKIRLETDFGDDKVSRRLSYYSVDQKGMTSLIEMPPEQTDDPSETLIASLESGNEILMKEISNRTYFQNGEEFMTIERNGQLSEIEINKDSKSLKCDGMDSKEQRCKCL